MPEIEYLSPGVYGQETTPTRAEEGISPAKIYECLATGIPVVSTPLPELERFGEHVYLAEGAEGFAEVLRSIPRLDTGEKTRARIELARKNSWEARFADIEKEIRRKR